MTDSITYRMMYYEELNGVSSMIMQIFDEHIAPLVSYKGRLSFGQYILAAAMEKRLNREHFVIVAVAEEQIVGMIEMREYKHIALLFVETAYQGQGIAKQLIAEALASCLQHNRTLEEITVNASINACAFYEKQGFQAYDEPFNELHATPMSRKLKVKDKG